MRRDLALLALWAAIVFVPSPAGAAEVRNVLLIVADDLGAGAVGAYGQPDEAARTPVLDSLAARGVLFRNAWSQPVCSPTRAAMLTGRHAFRTGIGNAMAFQGTQQELLLEEVTVAEVLPESVFTAVAGKWHLTTVFGTGPTHPLQQGFDRHCGTIEGLPGPVIGDGYSSWMKTVDGEVVRSSVYNTTATVDDALRFVEEAGDAPWMIWVTFNAPHSPYHAPPESLHTYDLPPAVEDDLPLHIRAMTEAMDTEIGRLFESMGPEVLAETVVFFAGDNGSSPDAGTGPPDQMKGSVYEGGVHVPLIVAGPGVEAGAHCHGLVHLADIFATVSELMGGDASTGVDSISLLPYLADPDTPSLREAMYTEGFFPNGIGPYITRQRAVRGPRYKLVEVYADGGTEPAETLCFDLAVDPDEQVDLLADGPSSEPVQQAVEALSAVLDEMGPFVGWDDLGGGLPGVAGTPRLVGTGTLEPGTPAAALVLDVAPSAPAVLIYGTAQADVPYKGGTLVPAPELFCPFVMDPIGALLIDVDWPQRMPPGLSHYFQFWIVDPAGPEGWSASNGVFATTEVGPAPIDDVGTTEG